MQFDIQELLSTYLLPFVIAVPFAILLFVLALRRGDDTPAPPAPKPASEPPPSPITETPVTEQLPGAILLVDDSAVARAKLRKLFVGAGYQVEVAGDGREALEALATGYFSVLITDLEMPNMDGFELIAAVQGSLETEDLPIIAITGHDELSARVHDYQGLYGIFKKPWNDRELLKRVEALASLRKRPRIH
ncbi:response regulator [Roseateles toxinivorans]|uniref:Response regulator receiver domain-containing protein n=1 Tax=Roseateles toxinivorans TaxID=270368 RepID=A0A4R6QTG2_9BURK|nr:response regulator [Roseateles toxinivorans]TDP74139.1 response regulator receiver domain-containing protein [Roseateles toxinivorans]